MREYFDLYMSKIIYIILGILLFLILSFSLIYFGNFGRQYIKDCLTYPDVIEAKAIILKNDAVDKKGKKLYDRQLILEPDRILITGRNGHPPLIGIGIKENHIVVVMISDGIYPNFQMVLNEQTNEVYLTDKNGKTYDLMKLLESQKGKGNIGESQTKSQTYNNTKTYPISCEPPELEVK